MFAVACMAVLDHSYIQYQLAREQDELWCYVFFKQRTVPGQKFGMFTWYDLSDGIPANPPVVGPISMLSMLLKNGQNRTYMYLK